MKNCVRGLFACGLVVAVAVSGSVWGTRAASEHFAKVAGEAGYEYRHGSLVRVGQKQCTTELKLEAHMTVEIRAINVEVQVDRKELSLVENNQLTSPDKRRIELMISGAPSVKISVPNIKKFDATGGQWESEVNVYPVFALYWDEALENPIKDPNGMGTLLKRDNDTVTISDNNFQNGRPLYIVVGMQYCFPGQDAIDVPTGANLAEEFSYSGNYDLTQQIVVEAVY